MHYPEFVLRLPDWVEEFLSKHDTVCPTVEDRMSLVIELSRLNAGHGTGGPFGAGIFDLQTGRLISPGVNLVFLTNCSVFHAEIVALILAQRLVGCYDLGGEGLPMYELVASTEPCAMCLGAVAWSGIRRLVCGARDEDARSIGFDEGPKPRQWAQSLEVRGITVLQDVCRDEARTVLREYLESGGIIYNGRQGKGFPVTRCERKE